MPSPSPYTAPAVSTFDVGYPDNPWANITTNERQYYDPMLRDIFRPRNVFAQFTQFQQSLAARNAKTMTITSLYDPHPDFDQVGLRDLYLPSIHSDSRSVDITFNHYSGKIAYTAYDDIVTYWQKSGGSASALRRIVNDKLGIHMVDTMDLLSRNALLSAPFGLYAGGATDFSGLTPSNIVATELINEIHLGMEYRRVPYANTAKGNVGTIVCVTSPGVLFDMQNQTDPREWLTPMAYGDPSRLLNYEVGTYRNVRFIKSEKCTLFNVGNVTIQATITAAITAGDGTPDPTTTLVDQTFKVGQPGATHYIQLAGGTDMTKFAVNDMVSIHLQRTSAFGVSNGADYRDGKKEDRRIVAINAGAHQLSFNIPIMQDFTTDLGGGVFGYVTKAMHVHASIFLGGSDGVVMGVGRPPRLHFPPPVDDLDAMFRFSWDAYIGYQTYNPDVLEVLYTAGSYRNVGQIQSGA